MKQSGTSGSGWRRAAGTAFVLAAFAFLGYFAGRNAAELRAHEWAIRPALLALSVLVNIAALFLGVKVWQQLLRRMNISVRLMPLARVWFVSGLGRYIPGKVWQFVGAAYLGGSAGLAPAVAVTSLAVHTGIFVIAAILMSVYLLPASLAEVVGVDLRLFRWFAPVTLLLVHPAVVGRVLRLVARVSRRDLAGWTGGWVDGIVLVGLAAVVWAVSGVAFYLFTVSVTPLPDAAVGDLVAINALAFVAGTVVFFVPAGLGAKEGALTALLSVFVPASVAAVLAIASRLWMIAAEVIPAVFLLRSPNERSTAPGSPAAAAASHAPDPPDPRKSDAPS